MFGLVKQSSLDAANLKLADARALIEKQRAELKAVCSACEERVKDLVAENGRMKTVNEALTEQNQKLFQANMKLAVQLEPFRAPRRRGAGGRFVSGKQVAA